MKNDNEAEICVPIVKYISNLSPPASILKPENKQVTSKKKVRFDSSFIEKSTTKALIENLNENNSSSSILKRRNHALIHSGVRKRVLPEVDFSNFETFTEYLNKFSKVSSKQEFNGSHNSLEETIKISHSFDKHGNSLLVAAVKYFPEKFKYVLKLFKLDHSMEKIFKTYNKLKRDLLQECILQIVNSEKGQIHIYYQIFELLLKENIDLGCITLEGQSILQFAMKNKAPEEFCLLLIDLTVTGQYKTRYVENEVIVLSTLINLANIDDQGDDVLAYAERFDYGRVIEKLKNLTMFGLIFNPLDDSIKHNQEELAKLNTFNHILQLTLNFNLIALAEFFGKEHGWLNYFGDAKSREGVLNMVVAGRSLLGTLASLPVYIEGNFQVEKAHKITSMVNFLHVQGAAIDQKDGQGATPLLKAASAGNSVLIESLLVNKAHLLAVDDEGNNIIHHAIPCCEVLESLIIQFYETKQLSTLKKLFAMKNKNGETPFLRATDIMWNKVDGIYPLQKLLLIDIVKPSDPSDSIYIKDRYARTILHRLCFKDSAQLIPLLPVKFVHRVIDEKDANEDTAMHLAIKLKNSACVAMLAFLGLMPSAVDKNKHNVLHLAARSEPNIWKIFFQKEKIFFWVRNQAILVQLLNDVDEDGNTPLHFAAQHKQGDEFFAFVFQYIPLETIVSTVNLKNSYEQTWLSLIIKNGLHETLRICDNIGLQIFESYNELHLAVESNNLQTVEEILYILDRPKYEISRDFVINFKYQGESVEYYGFTPIMRAMRGGENRQPLVKAILQRSPHLFDINEFIDASLNEKSGKTTCLHLAMANVQNLVALLGQLRTISYAGDLTVKLAVLNYLFWQDEKDRNAFLIGIEEDNEKTCSLFLEFLNDLINNIFSCLSYVSNLQYYKVNLKLVDVLAKCFLFYISRINLSSNQFYTVPLYEVIFNSIFIEWIDSKGNNNLISVFLAAPNLCKALLDLPFIKQSFSSILRLSTAEGITVLHGACMQAKGGYFEVLDCLLTMLGDLNESFLEEIFIKPDTLGYSPLALLAQGAQDENVLDRFIRILKTLGHFLEEGLPIEFLNKLESAGQIHVTLLIYDLYTKHHGQNIGNVFDLQSCSSLLLSLWKNKFFSAVLILTAYIGNRSDLINQVQKERPHFIFEQWDFLIWEAYRAVSLSIQTVWQDSYLEQQLECARAIIYILTGMHAEGDGIFIFYAAGYKDEFFSNSKIDSHKLLTIRNSADQTVLQMAAEHGNIQSCKNILDVLSRETNETLSFYFSHRDCFNRTVLRYAVRNNISCILKFIFEKKILLDSVLKAESGLTWFHLWSSINQPQNGAGLNWWGVACYLDQIFPGLIDQPDLGGVTPLLQAAIKRNKVAVFILLEKFKAKVTFDKEGLSFFHYIFSDDDIEMCQRVVAILKTRKDFHYDVFIERVESSSKHAKPSQQILAILEQAFVSNYNVQFKLCNN